MNNFHLYKSVPYCTIQIESHTHTHTNKTIKLNLAIKFRVRFFNKVEYLVSRYLKNTLLVNILVVIYFTLDIPRVLTYKAHARDATTRFTL